jgi:ABC-type sugar transport system substrate-binding protein
LFAAIAVASLVETVPAAEQKPTIPIIVKDTTTDFWQIVLAGARKAGKDLNVTVPQLGAQSESDINGQISILEITANPDLRGVFASNLTMAQGAGQAIAENKVSDKIKLVGFDSDDKTVKLLADGTIQALVVQDPFRMGYEGIKTALAASKGEKVPENVDTGVNLITKANMNTERSKELLTPDVTKY